MVQVEEIGIGFKWEYFSFAHGRTLKCEIVAESGENYYHPGWLYVHDGEDRQMWTDNERILYNIEQSETEQLRWENYQRRLVREKQEAVESAEKRETLEKYLATLSPMAAGRVRKTLEKKYNIREHGVVARFELIEILAGKGAKYDEYTMTMKPTREEKWTGARREKQTWDLGGYEDRIITKTGLDYFNWLKDNQA